jgi:hypothetical protein
MLNEGWKEKKLSQVAIGEFVEVRLRKRAMWVKAIACHD